MYQPRAKLGLNARARSTKRDHRVDVFAETRENQCRLDQPGVPASKARRPESMPLAEAIAIGRGAVGGQSHATAHCKAESWAILWISAIFAPQALPLPTRRRQQIRRQSERRAIVRIVGDRVSEEGQSLRHVSRRGEYDRACAQIDIVGGKIVGWAASGPSGLGGLQGRFDDAGDADRDLVLKLEHIFERAVETVGPEICARYRRRSVAR